VRAALLRVISQQNLNSYGISSVGTWDWKFKADGALFGDERVGDFVLYSLLSGNL
jgi:hypothetical protein